ncbi:MAG TPA: PAS domain-containing protein [Arsenicitalea sp.]|nr:PAS domain-containing protein [Arsenicitalea sp.]
MINSERALILAPSGRDGALAATLLKDAGKFAEACPGAEALLAELEAGAGVAIIAIEALQHADLKPLTTWIEQQPPWSDFPFIILTHRVGSPEQHPMLVRLQAIVGNVIFLDRPFHPSALINVVDNSLRGRRRQYQARDYLQELRQGEDRLATALLAGRMGAWEYHIETGEFDASPNCKANFGRGPEAPFRFEDKLASIAPEDRASVQLALNESIRTGADFVIEYRVTWPDGTRHWIDARARVNRDAMDRPASMVGVTSDITARKTAEDERERLLRELAAERERTQDALRGERALSGLLLTSVPAGIVAYDKDLNVTIWNPVMERLFGIGREQAEGRPLAQIIADGKAELIAGGLGDALKGIAGPAVEIELTTGAAGKITLESQYAPLRGGDGQIVGGAGFFRDITERRRVEEQLRHAQKMETIGQLTGGVAHDFNNLLAAVQGNLELLRKRLPHDPQLQRYIDGALQGASRGASLTARLLAFARKQELKPQPTDLVQLLEGMRGLMERSIGPLITTKLQLDAGLPPARVDPNQLELAILNLAVNARDAMLDGGELTISLAARDGAEALSGLSGRFLKLSVTDTGSGMDAATLRSAIEPFFSTKELGKGTGLGLSMVHGLAVQLGGTLRLRSKLGEGTTAELWLPVSSTPIDDLPIVAVKKAEAPRSRILVVDDDVLIAMNTVDLVEDLGHIALEANSGKRALEILAGDDQIDAMVTDYAMPGMNGVELASKARELRPRLPILLASGYAELPSGAELQLPRLGKPFLQADLALKLSQLLTA